MERVPPRPRGRSVAPTVRRFERGGEVGANLVDAIQRTLETAGVVLIDADNGGPGVRLHSPEWKP
jgi:hypothetical protein